MFKNLILFRVTSGLPEVPEHIETALALSAFNPCAPTQEKSSGWVPPRGEEHGLLIESIGGHWIMKLMTEVKKVPAQALNRAVGEKAKEIERQTGRKPGRKERKEIKEEVHHSLLPHAFASRTATLVWIDPETKMLAIDASAHARADEVITALVKQLDGLQLTWLNTQTAPQAAMAHWLYEQEIGHDFHIERECELKACDESKAVVKYGRHPLDTEEIKQHIAQGKIPTKLALTWDDRVSFVLTDGMQIKKISFLDVVFEGKSEADSGFDADVAIATGELAPMLAELIAVLGGEAKEGDAA